MLSNFERGGLGRCGERRAARTASGTSAFPTIQPVTEVQRLTWEQYLAGEPCPGCGRPMTDATLWSGSGKGSIHLSEEERARYDSEEEHFKVRHGDCHTHRWTFGGSLTTHCGKCCPPPPMSPEQTARIAALLHHALRDQQGLRVRKRVRNLRPALQCSPAGSEDSPG
jgi:hypothetical protein